MASFSNTMFMGRRQFLTYASVGASVGALSGFSNVALAQTELAVRQDVGSLTADGSVLSAYANGITAMRARAEDDPTSWLFQANIHGAFENTNPAWNQCQHGSFLFLSWHRMYLYFFERIVRSASGDSSFALPYWNYRLPAQRQLPEPFREPAVAADNALFLDERNPAANQGGFLPESSVLHEQAFEFTDFSSAPGSALSFGGQEVGGFTHFASPHGQVESQPHDIIHVLIGGQSGFMADPRLAARDPIFWLHHANIDRLWNRWLELGEGRANPVDNDAWSDTEFKFFDEDGSDVTLTGKEVLDTATQLDYRYDDDPIVEPDPVDPCPPPPPLTELAGAGPKLLLESAESVKLGDETVTVPIASAQESSGSLLEKVFTPSEGRVTTHSLVLKVEGIDYDEQPGVYYEVYVNLPADSKNPSARQKHYVGNISFFAIKPHHGDAVGGIQMFDITRAVGKLREDADWNANDIKVSFVKRGLESDLETTQKSPEARIGKISIIRE